MDKQREEKCKEFVAELFEKVPFVATCMDFRVALMKMHDSVTLLLWSSISKYYTENGGKTSDFNKEDVEYMSDLFDGYILKACQELNSDENKAPINVSAYMTDIINLYEQFMMTLGKLYEQSNENTDEQNTEDTENS